MVEGMLTQGRQCCQLSANSSHIGHWTKASTGVNSWVFLKDGKPTFHQHPPPKNVFADIFLSSGSEYVSDDNQSLFVLYLERTALKSRILS
jgi:hypothetical protein